MKKLRDPLLGSTPSVPGDGSSHQRPAVERIDLLDNAKAVLIVFVVIYHSIVVYSSADRPESPIAYWSGVLALLKAVVMPCFCAISGHLSRATLDERRARALLQLLATYLIFQAAYELNTYLAFRLNSFKFAPLPLQLFQPQEQVVTWFLMALLIWRASLPLLMAMRAPLAFATVLGLSSLYVDLSVNYQNILSFLPYFVLGHTTPRTLAATLEAPRVRAPLAALFVLVGFALVLFRAAHGALPHRAPSTRCTAESVHHVRHRCSSRPSAAPPSTVSSRRSP